MSAEDVGRVEHPHLLVIILEEVQVHMKYFNLMHCLSIISHLQSHSLAIELRVVLSESLLYFLVDLKGREKPALHSCCLLYVWLVDFSNTFVGILQLRVQGI